MQTLRVTLAQYYPRMHKQKERIQHNSNSGYLSKEIHFLFDSLVYII